MGIAQSGIVTHDPASFACPSSAASSAWVTLRNKDSANCIWQRKEGVWHDALIGGAACRIVWATGFGWWWRWRRSTFAAGLSGWRRNCPTSGTRSVMYTGTIRSVGLDGANERDQEAGAERASGSALQTADRSEATTPWMTTMAACPIRKAPTRRIPAPGSPRTEMAARAAERPRGDAGRPVHRAGRG